MTRLAFATLLLLHGIVHVIGFVVPWQIATFPDFAYTTTAAWRSLELGDAGVRLVGLVMLALAVAFPVAAYGVRRRAGWALPLTGAVALTSLLACVLQSPAAVLGVVIDLAILGVVLGAVVARGGTPRLPHPAR